jgi:aldehyde dehydrogenase (NAD+)
MAHSIPFDTQQVFIAGQWRAPAEGKTLPLENPSDGSMLAPIARSTAPDVDAAVSAARGALDAG